MLKEPEIRLFGMKISLPENGTVAAGGECSGDSSNESSNENGSSVNCELEVSREQERGDGEEKQEQGDEDQTTGELCETTAEEEAKNPEDCQHPNALLGSDDNPKTPPNEEDVMSDNQPKPENEINGPQKALTKPDKILPCPRCNSMDTKFCYYNNYNVNQPRHFCKSCQRYWTAGGTMRNVPVGAGRRKNKNMGSHCRHVTISEALRAAQTDTSDRFHNLKFGPNGSVLSFGPDSPLCNSVATTLNLAENRVPNGVSCEVEQGGLVSSRIGENVDDCSIRSGDGTQNRNGFSPPFTCIPGVPWPFPWNSAVPVSPICPPVYSLPYYTAPFWNVQWLSMQSPTTNQKVTGSGPTSPLGKHLRNGELINPNKSEHKEPLKSRSSENPIVVPKTLRIDDPEEAAKSSIWSTLGIKYDSFRREGLFKALQPTSDEKKPLVNTYPILQANPAALSRFNSFQERADDQGRS